MTRIFVTDIIYKLGKAMCSSRGVFCESDHCGDRIFLDAGKTLVQNTGAVFYGAGAVSD